MGSCCFLNKKKVFYFKKPTTTQLPDALFSTSFKPNTIFEGSCWGSCWVIVGANNYPLVSIHCYLWLSLNFLFLSCKLLNCYGTPCNAHLMALKNGRFEALKLRGINRPFKHPSKPTKNAKGRRHSVVAVVFFRKQDILGCAEYVLSCVHPSPFCRSRNFS